LGITAADPNFSNWGWGVSAWLITKRREELIGAPFSLKIKDDLADIGQDHLITRLIRSYKQQYIFLLKKSFYG
jgi:hypothetical protein